ncbi:hypothetical protein ACFSZS_12005 [Seohaeicola zhoushanensis]
MAHRVVTICQVPSRFITAQDFSSIFGSTFVAPGGTACATALAARDGDGLIALPAHALIHQPRPQAAVDIDGIEAAAAPVARICRAGAIGHADLSTGHENGRVLADLVGDRRVAQGRHLAGSPVGVEPGDADAGAVIDRQRRAGGHQREQKQGAGEFHALSLHAPRAPDN